jgi:hypothetical protein
LEKKKKKKKKKKKSDKKSKYVSDAQLFANLQRASHHHPDLATGLNEYTALESITANVTFLPNANKAKTKAKK